MDAASTLDGEGVMVGPAAPAMRRRLGPLAWCALETLCELATLPDHRLIADVSVLDLACDLGVAKNTAHRALKTLRSAGLIEHRQARGEGGRFDASSYRLTIPDDVLTRQLFQPPTSSRRSRGTRRGVGRPVVAAPPVVAFGEQLVLPLA